jgi:signal transduction histidine kinase/CheY-like chemotaxis protein
MIKIKDKFIKKISYFIFAFVISGLFLEGYVIYYSLSKEIVKTIDNEAVLITRHISHLLFPETAEIVTPTAETGPIIDELKNDFNFMKLKVFKADGEVTFSTENQEVGEVNNKDYFHKVVGHGSVYTKIVQKNSNSSEGKKVTVDVAETYVPVMRNGKFIGAVELYYDVSDKNRRFHHVLFSSITLTIAVTVTLLSVIFYILLRLDMNIDERKRILKKLEASNIDLATTKAETEKNHNELQKEFDKMSSLIQEVATTENVTLRYDNQYLTKCYQQKQCLQKRCPCYGLEAMRCWQVAGTFCGNKVQGAYAQKYENCSLCDVYKHAVPTPSSSLGEHFNNMMHILHAKHQELENTFNQLNTTQTHLLQQEKMASIGVLAGGIAHEFNNILSVILGYAALAKDDVPEGNSVKADLEIILKAGNRAKDLVKQILTFSHQSDESLNSIQLQYIIKEAIKMLKTTTPSSIEVRQDISIDCNNVLANSTMIHQLLINLYNNAVQAMNQKGILKISMRQVTNTDEDNTGLPALLPGEYVKLAISDNGPGIEPSIKDRIFDPFFTTKEVGHGTGMGLSVVHGIVKKLGGSIYVDSEPGKGATFCIYFPVTNKEESNIQEESIDPIVMGNEHILFVDDEIIMAHMGKQILERLGYKVSTRTCSIEAFEAFRAQPEKYDLIITDQTMPHFSGDELAKSLLEIRPDIPIILCTGYSSIINEKKATEIGIRAFVMKPIEARLLAQTIRQVLDGNKSSIPAIST